MSGVIAGISIAVVGLGLTAAGQMQQASAAKAAANYQSQVAASNQQIATQNANYAAASGEQQAAISQQKTRADIGAIEAGQGSSGVDINSPTASAVRTSATEVGALDAQTIRSNAARTAYGYETQSTNFGNQASADQSQAANDLTAGYVGGAGGLLSGVGNESMNYAGVMNKANGIGAAEYSSPIGPTGAATGGEAMGNEIP